MATDVLVTGAGPVGLAMAAELARYGLTVRLIDKAPARTDKSKALVVWPRTLELLDCSDCGDALLAAGRTATAANLMSGATTLAHIKLTEVDSPHPYVLMIPQSETERVLEEHCNPVGVTVERSTELTTFTASASGVTCTLAKPDATTETVEAAWLVACDGAHSAVRHQLGLEFAGDTLPSDWMLADVHLAGLPSADEMYIFLHEAGALAIFPIGAPGQSTGPTTRARVIANVGNAQPGVQRPDPTLAETQAVLDQRGTGELRASDPVWLANFTINERKVADYRASRIFLAGDAAHIHSPAGGQGMNTGIQDACNLAWKLAMVHHGAAADWLLDSYSAERSPVAAEVLKETGALTSLATMHNPGLLAMRNTVVSLVLGFSPAKHAMAEKLSELAIHYPESPLNGAGSHPHRPKPGERAPVQSVPVGAGSSPRFALFADPSDEVQALLTRFPKLLEAKARAPFAEGGLWLVRPDGYVAAAVEEKDLKLVQELLARIAG
jgi:2-polyprenyl-6-methoxyphenol hydroxylase-like FAD-dependent oxidoreductase